MPINNLIYMALKKIFYKHTFNALSDIRAWVIFYITGYFSKPNDNWTRKFKHSAI